MLLFMCFPRLVQILPVYLRLLREGGQYAKNSGAATPEALLRGTRFVILKKRGEDYERKILRVPARRQRERDRHENGALGADFLKIGFENVKQALSVRRPRFYPQRAGDTGRAGRRAGRPCPGHICFATTGRFYRAYSRFLTACRMRRTSGWPCIPSAPSGSCLKTRPLIRTVARRCWAAKTQKRPDLQKHEYPCKNP